MLWSSLGVRCGSVIARPMAPQLRCCPSRSWRTAIRLLPAAPGWPGALALAVPWAIAVPLVWRVQLVRPVNKAGSPALGRAPAWQGSAVDLLLTAAGGLTLQARARLAQAERTRT